MKVLITGNQGFIGSHATDYFLDRDHTVIGIDSNITGNLEHQKQNPRLHSIIGKLSKEMLENLEEIDCIVHLAAFNSIPKSVMNPDGYIRNNTLSMQLILEFAKEKGIKRVIYASSSSVTNSVPSPYSISKMMNELQAKTYNTHYGLECIGLRFFNIFGPRQKYKESNAPVIPKWIYQMMKDEFILIRDGNEVSRDFTYVENACSAIFKACTSEFKEDLFNIGCGDSATLNEVFGFINKEMSFIAPRKVKREQLRLGEKYYSKADISRAKECLNYSPIVEWREGIRKTIEYIKEQERILNI